MLFAVEVCYFTARWGLYHRLLISSYPWTADPPLRTRVTWCPC